MSGCPGVLGQTLSRRQRKGPAANADNSGSAFSIMLIWADPVPTFSGPAAGGHGVGVTAANVATRQNTQNSHTNNNAGIPAHARWFGHHQMAAVVDDGSKWWRWWRASPNGGDGGERPQMVAMVESVPKWWRWWRASPNGGDGGRPSPNGGDGGSSGAVARRHGAVIVSTIGRRGQRPSDYSHQPPLII